jgi:hypothetical protein
MKSLLQYVKEGTEDNNNRWQNKVGQIKYHHDVQASAARQEYPKNREAETHHMIKSRKAFNLLQKIRTRSDAPKPKTPAYSDYGSAIAADYAKHPKGRD